MIGNLWFIAILLVMAGIEPNPGPTGDQEGQETEALFSNINVDIRSETTTIGHMFCQINTNGLDSDAIASEIKDWEEDEEHFFETRATAAIIEALETYSAVVITGSIGSGKTYSMKHAALHLKKQGYTLYPITDLSEISVVKSKTLKQAWILDDILCGGSNRFESWKNHHKNITTCMKDKKSKLLISLRTQEFNEYSENILQLVADMHVVDISSEHLKLNDRERELFISHLMKIKGIGKPSDAVLRSAKNCKFDFFPLLCQIFCSNECLRKNQLFFKEPFEYLENYFSNIMKNNEVQFCGLVLCIVYDGRLPTRIFDNFRNDVSDKEREKVDKIVKGLFDKPISLNDIKKQLDVLDRVFVHRKENEYKIMQDIFQTIVAFVVGREKRGFIIEHCNVRFVLERCTLSREVTNFRKSFNRDVLKLTLDKAFAQNDSDKSLNQYVIKIDEELETHLASKLLQEIEKHCLPDYSNCPFIAEMFESVFLQDKRFLDIMYSIICNVSNTALKYELKYKGLVNRCLMSNNIVAEEVEDIARNYRLRILFQSTEDETVTQITPILACSYSGNVNMMKILVQTGNFDVNIRYKRSFYLKSYVSPLTISIFKRQKEVSLYLISQSVDINLGNPAPLVVSIKEKDLDLTKRLVESGAYLNKCDFLGNSPLTYSVSYKCENIVQILLKSQVDVNIRGNTTTALTPLCAACDVGDVDVAQSLILRYGADVNKFDGCGCTPLQHSVARKQSAVTNFLLEQKANVNLCGESEHAVTPLCTACDIGSITTVHVLLSHGADIDKCDGHGNTPLQHAIFNNFTHIAKFLIHKNADVNVSGSLTNEKEAIEVERIESILNIVDIPKPDALAAENPNAQFPIDQKMHCISLVCKTIVNIMVNLLQISIKRIKQKTGQMTSTPLCTSSYRGNEEMVKLLLSRGAKVNKYDEMGYTPLTHSIVQNNKAIMNILLSEDADVNLCGDTVSAETPLCAACYLGNKEAVKLLIEKADINQGNGYGQTALTCCIAHNHLDVAKLILDSNADVNIYRNGIFAVSPLGAACLIGNIKAVKLLLNYQVDVNAYDGMKFTPLLYSVFGNYIDITNYLLENKADVRRCSNDGLNISPLSAACAGGKFNIMRSLLKHPKGKEMINICSTVGSSPLSHSVTSNNIEMAECLLKYGADVNTCETGVTPLAIACKENNCAMVDLLLQYKANAEKCDILGNSPLTFSVGFDSYDVTKLLLSKLPNNDSNDTNLLIMAIEKRHLEIIKLLVSNKADINQCNSQGLTPLLAAVNCHSKAKNIRNNRITYTNRNQQMSAYLPTEDYMDVINLLLELHADVNKCGVRGITPLHLSIGLEQIETTKLLLNSNADVNMLSDKVPTPLCLAIKTGNFKIINLLLSNNADVNKCSNDQFTPLLLAIVSNQIKTIELLLSNKADVNMSCQDEHGMTPLCLAANIKNVAVVDLLLSYNADVNKCCGKGLTPLILAIANGHILLNKQADVNMSGKNKMGKTPLCLAAVNGTVAVVDLLLSHNADVNKYDDQGSTPLHHAIDSNNIEVVQFLLKNKADADMSGKKTEALTPLGFAAVKGNAAAVDLLLSHNADVNKCCGEGFTPLLLSIVYNQIKITELLISKNADVNMSSRGERSVTPLCLAAEKGNVAALNLLLSHNADVNKCCSEGFTPLLLSIAYNQIKITELLISKNVDVNMSSRGERSVTPLCFAAEKGNVAAVNLLLSYNADVNKCCGEGFTPLLLAIIFNQIEITELLISKNANVNMSSRDGRSVTPLCLAAKMGNVAAVNVLVSHNVDMNKCTGKGLTPLLLSIDCDQIQVTKILLNKNVDVNMSVKTKKTKTPLGLAAVKGNLAAVDLLLSHNADVNKCDDRGITPLHYAIEYDKIEIVKHLLSKNADANMTSNNAQALTPLGLAAVTGNLSAVDLLMTHNADVNKCCGEGFTPLLLSIVYNQIKITELLISKNADVNMSSRGERSVTPLCFAAEKGNVAAVNLLLRYNADVNKCCSEGLTPLLMAIIFNQIEITDLLLSKDADVNMSSRGGRSVTPLCLAAEKGNVAAVNLLVSHNVDMNKCTGKGLTPLLLSIDCDQIQVTKILLNKNVDVNMSVKTKKTKTPLGLAAVKGNLAAVDLLLSHNADVNKCDDRGITPLHYAIEYDKIEIVKHLLSKNADANMTSNNAQALTPLGLAAVTGNLSAVDLLMTHNADVNKCCGEGFTPLLLSIVYNQIKITELLISKNVDVNMSSRGERSVTPLCFAAEKGNVAAVNLLLSYNADVNKCCSEGLTPLLMAIIFNQIEITDLLLSKNADVNMSSRGGRSVTPLCLAAEKGNVAAVNLLLSHNADVNKCCGEGLTPLLFAVASNQTKTTELLLSKNANVNISSRDGRSLTPLHFAVANKKLEIIHILLRHEADVNKCNSEGVAPLTLAKAINEEEIIKLVISKNQVMHSQ